MGVCMLVVGCTGAAHGSGAGAVCWLPLWMRGGAGVLRVIYFHPSFFSSSNDICGSCDFIAFKF